jgi:hypothetical protein
VLLLVLGSCRNNNLPWRSGMLVTQIHRQYKQQILLGYNDFQQKMVIDNQQGYAKGYFDNYRNQIIFATEGSLEYMIGQKQITTSTNGVSGYVYRVLLNESYQIGVEILDVKRDELGSDKFLGMRTRIIDLNTRTSVIISGFPSDCMLSGKNIYCDNYDEDYHDFLDIVDVETMTHTRLDTDEKQLTFYYTVGDQTFVQSNTQGKVFLVNENKLIEQTRVDRGIHPLVDRVNGRRVLKDIAPINSGEHWYVNQFKQFEKPYAVELFKFSFDKVERVFVDFNRKDIIQIVDVANYGSEYFAILYQTQSSENNPNYEYIAVYDMNGQPVELREVTELGSEGTRDRFIALDYVE